MTINQAITRLRAMKKTQMDDNTLIGWLSELDGMIYEEIVKWHEQDKDKDGNTVVPAHGPYNEDTDVETELLVPAPYADVYIYYLMAQLEQISGDFNRYNNSMIMYNTRLQAFASWYNRNHMPVQGNCIRI